MTGLDLLEGVELEGYSRADFGPMSFWLEASSRRYARVLSSKASKSYPIGGGEPEILSSLLVEVFEGSEGGVVDFGSPIRLHFLDRATFVDRFVRVPHERRPKIAPLPRFKKAKA